KNSDSFRPHLAWRPVMHASTGRFHHIASIRWQRGKLLHFYDPIDNGPISVSSQTLSNREGYRTCQNRGECSRYLCSPRVHHGVHPDPETPHVMDCVGRFPPMVNNFYPDCIYVSVHIL